MKTLTVEQILNLKWEPTTEESRKTDPNRYVYSVKKVTNSITPNVGQLLNHIELAELCDSIDWNVGVV